MKKVLLFISLAILLGGCGNTIPDIKKELGPLNEKELGGSDESEIKNSFVKLAKSIANQTENVYLFEALYSNSINWEISLPFDFKNIYYHNLESADHNVSQLWNSFHRNVVSYNRAASLASKSSDPQIKQFKNYAYSYIGFNYWAMMELWGDLIYWTPENFSDNSKDPTREKIDVIRKDLVKHLEKAVVSIPFGKNEFKFDKAFPLAVLVRLALQAKEYDKVKQYAEQIINHGSYQLASLSELHSSGAETIVGYQKDEYLGEEFTRSPYFNLISKGNCVHIIRYTEIILAAAEAHLKLGDKENALLYLNKVRTRNNKINLDTSDSNQLLDSILLEISEDLGKEGLWFSALKRNELAMERLSIPQYKLLLPIPRIEIEIRYPMAQNPGY